MTKFIHLLFFASATIAAVLQPQDSKDSKDSKCNAGAITKNNRNCNVECGTDHGGGDYAALLVADFSACADACGADKSCVTAQYVTSSSYCYLKSIVNPSSTNSNVNSIVCQETSTCKDGSVTINSRTGTIQCGIDHPGGDYSAQVADSQRTCQNLCAADSKCLTAQYAILSKYCYLKSAVSPAVANSNVNGIIFTK